MRHPDLVPHTGHPCSQSRAAVDCAAVSPLASLSIAQSRAAARRDHLGQQERPSQGTWIPTSTSTRPEELQARDTWYYVDGDAWYYVDANGITWRQDPETGELELVVTSTGSTTSRWKPIWGPSFGDVKLPEIEPPKPGRPRGPKRDGDGPDTDEPQDGDTGGDDMQICFAELSVLVGLCNELVAIAELQRACQDRAKNRAEGVECVSQFSAPYQRVLDRLKAATEDCSRKTKGRKIVVSGGVFECEKACATIGSCWKA